MRIRTFDGERLTESVFSLLKLVLLVFISGCGTPTYTSKDISALPCEQASFFFYPVEFDAGGNYVYPDQIDLLQERLPDAGLRDLFVVIHGWDKTAAVAEQDYQDFICRFYFKGLSGVRRPLQSGGQSSTNGVLIVGVFWPSTFFPNFTDPEFLKPFSYFTIRGRADVLAFTGFQKFLFDITKSIGQRNPASHLRLHILGHSFGARITIKGLYQLISYNPETAQTLFGSVNSLNVFLLQGAVSRSVLKKPEKSVRESLETLEEKHNRRETPDFRKLSSEEISILFHELLLLVKSDDILPRLQELLPRMRIFNIYSARDWATRFLYPIASTFTLDDRVECGIGSCPAEDYPTLVADQAGHITFPPHQNEAGILNIDARLIVSSHSDIYKGRVVTLIWDLLGHISEK